MSLQNVEDLLHERGIDICHEIVRFRSGRFGPLFAAEIRKCRVQAIRSSRWHLEEMFVKINGQRHYLWREVDHEREVLESFVTKNRDWKAALKILGKAMRRYGQPQVIVTDKVRAYGAALKEPGAIDRQRTGRWLTNRAANSNLPFRRRERAMPRLRRMRNLQMFASFQAYASSHSNLERHLCSCDDFKRNRTAVLAEWCQPCAGCFGRRREN